MPVGQIEHVDVVAHAGAVDGVVVAAEDLQAGAFAHRHLGHIRHQVVRHAARVFADQAAFVCARRVEVAQVGDRPVRVGKLQVAQDVFAHQLGRAVGVGGGHRRVFAQGQMLRLRRAVNGGAGTEHQRLAGVLLHGIAQREQSAEVVAVIRERLLHAFSHRLEGREMHHRLDAVLRENGVHRGKVADIDLLEHRHLAAQSLEPVQYLRGTVREVVDAHHPESGGLQREPGVRGDVAGRTGEQDRAPCHRSRYLARQPTLLTP